MVSFRNAFVRWRDVRLFSKEHVSLTVSKPWENELSKSSTETGASLWHKKKTPRARQEHLQSFVSALKTVCTRTSVESLRNLMTGDRDLPVFRRAVAYAAYEEALVRTQARNAQLSLWRTLKQNQELLCIALDIARSEMLGLVISVSLYVWC